MRANPGGTVALITLGCARNEVDSEELAARLAAGGWNLVDDPHDADAVLVNTCGFVDVAKKDSIDTILAASDLKGAGEGPSAVVAVGCLAERYGHELAESLPEADAVLGFDDYPDIAESLRRIVGGEAHEAHRPRDRRLVLPVTPTERPAAPAVVPGHADREAAPPYVMRRRLESGPVASVKLASGCDRRCTFCAIPTFRGAFVSRPVVEVLTDVTWLVDQGVREVVLVSENSTSYGKDLGDLRLLETLIGDLGGTGISRVRVAYLQPAEVRPTLVAAMASAPVVADYFDLSFQHASPTVLRRMRRFGGGEDFLALIETIRRLRPEAGIRSNVIVGFPGETEEEFQELVDFLSAARLDAIGVFGYSDEDGTEAAELDAKIDESVIRERLEHVTDLVNELMAQRAEERIGTIIEVLIEEIDAEGAIGRAAHQGPDDGSTCIRGGTFSVGDLVACRVIDTDGVDLVAEPIE